MFKNKHFEVKVKKDEKNEEETSGHDFHPAEIGMVAEDVVLAITAGYIVCRTVNTLLRMAEHVVVTKVA